MKILEEFLWGFYCRGLTAWCRRPVGIMKQTSIKNKPKRNSPAPPIHPKSSQISTKNQSKIKKIGSGTVFFDHKPTRNRPKFGRRADHKPSRHRPKIGSRADFASRTGFGPILIPFWTQLGATLRVKNGPCWQKNLFLKAQEGNKKPQWFSTPFETLLGPILGRFWSPQANPSRCRIGFNSDQEKRPRIFDLIEDS